MRRALVVLCCLVCTGCAATLKAEGDPAPVSSGKFTSQALAGGVTVTTVDATSSMEWQHFDLDTGEAVAEDAGWDLAFSRQRVLSNSGVTGDGDVAMALLKGVAFEHVAEVPSEATFDVDHEDTDQDTNKDADNIFNGPGQTWYAYNEMTHLLTPHDDTYLIRSSEQHSFKLRVEGYYDAVGTSGMLRFRWAELEAAQEN